MNFLITETTCKKLKDYMEASIPRYKKEGLSEKDLILPLNIGINAGNYWVKNRGDYGKSIYKTACVAIEPGSIVNLEENMENGRLPRVININGTYFKVGEGISITGDLMVKPVEEFRALMLMAIAKQVAKKAKFKKVKLVEVSVGVGLSVKEFDKPGYRDHLRNILSGMHKIKYQGLEFIISISKKNIAISAEGYAHFQANYSDFVGNDDMGLYLLDIGSETLDTVFILNESIEKSDSQPLGVLRLIENITDRVSGESEHATQSYIEKLVRTGSIELERPYSMSEFQDLKNKYEEGIRIYLNNKYRSIGVANKIVALGGGACVIGDFLKENYRNLEIPANAEYLNAEAYYILSFK
ncbi:ParM/StbA family protein [Clostridium perfringens]|uniref:ParM/StbA family protein n=1 Tax=Clostridium perfringens TaxID=1502 RepID=UPI0013E32AE3|nr:hypothetical protein [Clostridium perfringens]MDZ4983317.1 hypothetical protein [Clostridium perfringens]NGT04452.1 hypothetical protein [Clostridium perfringens]